MKKAVNVSGGKKKRRTMVYGACEGALQDGVVQVVGPCRRSPKCVFVRALSKQSLRSVSTSLWSVPSYVLCAEAFPKRQREPSLWQLGAVRWGPVAVPREQSSGPAPPLP